MPTSRLDLAAIERSLRAVQRDFDRINASLDTPRDPFDDEVLERMLAGYRFVDQLQAWNVDLLERGSSEQLLQLNCLILCENPGPALEECSPQFRLTMQRFYDDSSQGGVRALMNYLADHRHPTVWRRAAGVYIQMLSEPQLFFEGNHRTGALLTSHILVRQGRPPFVLSPENAKAYFDPSSLIKGYRKGTFKAMREMPRLRNRIADLLEATAVQAYLIPPHRALSA
ncbi:hypothetical protein [Thiorhodococcus minor]|uniref:Fido domain-containing protein n=1 Tax=Thiorhodococcus minor TaxID=57489 RepID=A0A6M0K6A9_9GAMM|nr:hypothetical protein [Thiorhodococcus minor]NEV64473.1 hypothetical protein [Thiorhodococcus minor]